KALRHQHFHRLPQQLLAVVAEQCLHLAVDQRHAPGAVDQQHRHWRVLDDQAQPVQLGQATVEPAQAKHAKYLAHSPVSLSSPTDCRSATAFSSVSAQNLKRSTNAFSFSPNWCRLRAAWSTWRLPPTLSWLACLMFSIAVAIWSMPTICCWLVAAICTATSLDSSMLPLRVRIASPLLCARS